MLSADPNVAALVPLDDRAPAAGSQRVDVIFPVLHGTYGEDGTVQGLLDLAGTSVRGLGRAGFRGGHGQGHAEKAVPAGEACRWEISWRYSRSEWEKSPGKAS